MFDDDTQKLNKNFPKLNQLTQYSQRVPDEKKNKFDLIEKNIREERKKEFEERNLHVKHMSVS